VTLAGIKTGERLRKAKMDDTLDPSYDPWTDTTNNMSDMMSNNSDTTSNPAASTSNPAASTSSFFGNALAALPQLATAGLGVFGAIQNAKTNATKNATDSKTAQTAANAQATATVNWSKYLPWAIGGSALILGIFFLMRKKS
jgi:hypothetical protein